MFLNPRCEPYFYSYYGYVVISEIPLPDLPIFDSDLPCSQPIYIRLGTVPTQLEGADVIKKVRNQTAPGRFLLQVAGVADYYAHDGREIIVTPCNVNDLASVSVFLLSSMMAAILYQRGCYLLHASAVEKDGMAYLFAGVSGMGKSTTAASLIERGYRLLCDDVSFIREVNGLYYVVPAYPILKLWPDAIDAVYGEKKSRLDKVQLNQMEQVRSGINKYKVAQNQLESHFLCSVHIPIKMVYVLSREDSPYIEQLTGFDAVAKLKSAVYRAGILRGEGREAAFFDFSHRLIEKVAIKKACTGKLMSSQNDFIDLLCCDFQQESA